LKKPFFYILLILCFGCQTEKNYGLDGYWFITEKDWREGEVYEYDEIIFEGDSLRLSDGFSFETNGTYSIHKDSILFQLRNGEKFKTPFRRIAKDSILIFNNKHFQFESDSTYFPSKIGMEIYDLVGVNTQERISDKYYHVPIHLYYKDGVRKIRIRETFIEDLSQVYLALNSIHHNYRKSIQPLIFIGKNVKIKDLNDILLNSGSSSQRYSLIVNQNYEDGYHLFIDKNYIWGEIYEDKIKERKAPPPPPFKTSFRKYFIENGFEVIKLCVKEDNQRLDNLKENGKYIFSICGSHGIESYIRIKNHLRTLRKQKNILYRTEII